MHIYTVKASSLKFFGVLFLALSALVMLAVFIPGYTSADSTAVTAAKYTGIKTNDERIIFLSEFGYEVLPDPVEVKEVVIPEKFDSVYQTYNDIQRSQGLNLEKYHGKKATRYTYSITNYDGHETAIANLIVYKDKIIAGDICDTGDKGFIHGFEKK